MLFTFSFILNTNASSVPDILSARVTTASFADPTHIALSKSLTVISSPASKYIWDPPIDAAVALTFTFSSSDKLPFSSSSIISIKLIILVIEAGAYLSFELLSWIISPVDASINIELLALSVSPKSSAFTFVINIKDKNNTIKTFFILHL